MPNSASKGLGEQAYQFDSNDALRPYLYIFKVRKYLQFFFKWQNEAWNWHLSKPGFKAS